MSDKLKVKTWTVQKRGCGWPKAGGLYMVSGERWQGCGKFPFTIEPCDHCLKMGLTCSLGYSRAPRWADLDALLAQATCKRPEVIAPPGSPQLKGKCPACPADAGELGMGILTWVGAKHYPTAREYLQEVDRQGISWRVAQLPNKVVIGETWALCCHVNAVRLPLVNGEEPQWKPGAVALYRIDRVNYVVKDGELESEEGRAKLERLQKRGITLVRVERTGVVEQKELL